MALGDTSSLVTVNLLYVVCFFSPSELMQDAGARGCFLQPRIRLLLSGSLGGGGGAAPASPDTHRGLAVQVVFNRQKRTALPRFFVGQRGQH